MGKPQVKRRVLVLNHFARPRNLAGGTRHVELFSRLDGWQARVVAGDHGLKGSEWRGRDGTFETVRTLPYSTNGIGRILNWVSYLLSSFVRGIWARPLHLVYGSSPHLLAGLAGWAIARVRRVPFVLEVRDVWPRVLVDMGTVTTTSLVYRVLEHIELFLYRHADRVVFLAEGVEAHLVERGVPLEDTLFIPNGADSADFVPSASRSVLRDRYGMTGLVAVYAGAHGPANGLDLLLDAAKVVQQSIPEVSVLLVGDGVDKTRLAARVRAERIENVRFMAPIPKNEIPDLLAAADIGVHCLADVELFRTGVSPNKLFDYMAAGLPALTNTPGVCTDFLDAAGGGVTVDPRGLASGLIELAGLTDGQRHELGQAGQRHLAATRSRSAMSARLEALLDELVPVTGSSDPDEVEVAV